MELSGRYQERLSTRRFASRVKYMETPVEVTTDGWPASKLAACREFRA